MDEMDELDQRFEALLAATRAPFPPEHELHRLEAGDCSAVLSIAPGEDGQPELVRTRAVFAARHSVERLWHLLHHTATRDGWDDTYELELLQGDPSSGRWVSSSLVPGVLMVSDRFFVVESHAVRLASGGVAIVDKDFGGRHKAPSGAIRGRTVFSGSTIERRGGEVVLDSVSQTDLNGIPSWIVTQFAPRIAKQFFGRLVQQLELLPPHHPGLKLPQPPAQPAPVQPDTPLQPPVTQGLTSAHKVVKRRRHTRAVTSSPRPAAGPRQTRAAASRGPAAGVVPRLALEQLAPGEHCGPVTPRETHRSVRCDLRVQCNRGQSRCHRVIGTVRLPAERMAGQSAQVVAERIARAARQQLKLRVRPVMLNCRLPSWWREGVGAQEAAVPWGGWQMDGDIQIDHQLLVHACRLVLECELVEMLI